MPRKTRKQKLAAAARSSRGTHAAKPTKAVTTTAVIQKPNQVPVNKSVVAQEIVTDRGAAEQKGILLKTSKKTAEQIAADQALRATTFRDIARTTVVIGLLFGIQAALYFAHQKGYLLGLLE